MKRKLSEEEKRISEANLKRMQVGMKQIDREVMVLDFDLNKRLPLDIELGKEKLIELRKQREFQLKSMQELERQIKEGVEAKEVKDAS